MLLEHDHLGNEIGNALHVVILLLGSVSRTAFESLEAE